MEILQWLEFTGLAQWVLGSNYGYYVLLMFHSIGMALVVGVILMLDMRLLGYGTGLPVIAFDRLISVGWIGFLVNAGSGALLYISAATRYTINLPFLIKMVLIALGGWTIWYLGRMIRQAGPEMRFADNAKTVAILSMVFWIGAIVAGRVIAYTLDGPVPPLPSA